jgi:hypothetical protein
MSGFRSLRERVSVLSGEKEDRLKLTMPRRPPHLATPSTATTTNPALPASCRSSSWPSGNRCSRSRHCCEASLRRLMQLRDRDVVVEGKKRKRRDQPSETPCPSTGVLLLSSKVLNRSLCVGKKRENVGESKRVRTRKLDLRFRLDCSLPLLPIHYGHNQTEIQDQVRQLQPLVKLPQLERPPFSSSSSSSSQTLTTLPSYSFKAAKTYSPIHTGGKAVLSGDGGWLVSTLNEQALVTDVETGELVEELKGVRTAFILSPVEC